MHSFYLIVYKKKKKLTHFIFFQRADLSHTHTHTHTHPLLSPRKKKKKKKRMYFNFFLYFFFDIFHIFIHKKKKN